MVFPLNGGKTPVYLHGAADVYNRKEKRLEDWKFTKAEAMAYSKDDHHAQLNVLAYIWRHNGRPVSQLRNTYLFRNWESRHVKEGSPYPTSRIRVVDVPLWDEHRTKFYIENRLLSHFGNEKRSDDALDFCTDAERWVRASTYRVLKVDEATGEPQKMAKHTASSRMEAEDRIAELLEEDWQKVLEKNNKLKSPKPEGSLKRASFVVQERKAAPLRCSYCEASKFCNQRRNELLAEAGVDMEDEA